MSEDRPDRPSRAARLVLSLEQQADRPWFLPAVGVFPLSDYVFPFLPNQMLLLGLSVALPHRWWQLALSFVFAAGLGALLTALAIQQLGPSFMEMLLGAGPDAETVADVMAAIERHGFWALVALAMLPWPPRTAVVICALAGLPSVSIGAAVAVGRLVPVVAYTLIGAHAPGLLRRWRRIDDLLDEVETRRHARGADPGEGTQNAPGWPHPRVSDASSVADSRHGA